MNTSTPVPSQRKPTGRRRGRPSRYTPELARRICEEMAGGKSLRKICAAEGMPRTQLVLSWALGYVRDAKEDGFPDQYVRARERRGELYADEIIDIADEEPDPQRARVRVDARKWVASKLLPKTYGDRVEVDARVSGGVLLVPAPVDPASWAAVAESQQRAIEMQRTALPESVEPATFSVVESAEAETERGGVSDAARK